MISAPYFIAFLASSCSTSPVAIGINVENGASRLLPVDFGEFPHREAGAHHELFLIVWSKHIRDRSRKRREDGDGDVSSHNDIAGSLSRAAELRNAPGRTANSHSHIEIVAIYDRQVGHLHAA